MMIQTKCNMDMELKIVKVYPTWTAVVLCTQHVVAGHVAVSLVQLHVWQCQHNCGGECDLSWHWPLTLTPWSWCCQLVSCEHCHGHLCHSPHLVALSKNGEHWIIKLKMLMWHTWTCWLGARHSLPWPVSSEWPGTRVVSLRVLAGGSDCCLMRSRWIHSSLLLLSLFLGNFSELIVIVDNINFMVTVLTELSGIKIKWRGGGNGHFLGWWYWR